MAKGKKKKSKDSAVAKSYVLCAPGDRSCQGAHLPSVSVDIRPGFRYTSGTAVPPRTASARRARGCEENPKGHFTGRLTGGKPDAFCKAQSDPCGDPKNPRTGCPVQLVFIEGAPNLRFCEKPGEPGYLVPVDSPEHAEKIARKACEKWPNKPKASVSWPPGFFQKNAAGLVVEPARKAHPKSPWGSPGLGAVAVDQKPFGSALWLAGGTALGFLLWRFMQKPLEPTQT